MPEPEYPINKDPKCLYLKVNRECTGEGYQPLEVTLNFNLSRIDTKLGEIEYGLKGGELCITLMGGELPYEKRKLYNAIQLIIESQREVENKDGTEYTAEAEAGSGVKVDSKGGSTEKSKKQKAGVKETASKSVKDTFKHNLAQLTSKGDPENPVFCFICKTEEKALSGYLTNHLLGEINKNDDKIGLHSNFTISENDIVVLRHSGMLRYITDLSKNKVFSIYCQRKISKSFNNIISIDKVQYEQ